MCCVPADKRPDKPLELYHYPYGPSRYSSDGGHHLDYVASCVLHTISEQVRAAAHEAPWAALLWPQLAAHVGCGCVLVGCCALLWLEGKVCAMPALHVLTLEPQPCSSVPCRCAIREPRLAWVVPQPSRPPRPPTAAAA